MTRQLPRVNVVKLPHASLKPSPSPSNGSSAKRTPTTAIPIPLWLAGFAFFGAVSFVGTKYYILLSRPIPSFDPRTINLVEVYNTTAKDFDDKMEREEYWWGILNLRKRLARMAQGDVLESAVGTGRNSEFFDGKKVKSLVLVDESEGMLDICKEKWKVVSEGTHKWNDKVAFWVGNLAEDGVDQKVSPPDVDRQADAKHGKFDTVIQTMGLCSTNEPDKLLRNLGKLVKEDGQILLLEHGKGYYDWINKYLDVQAPDHAQRHGCWWNRDIGAIVEQSGLEILDMKRYTLGTTWWFVLKRPANFAEPVETSNEEMVPKAKSWWEVWR